MKVLIKSFDVKMEIKQKGIELEVRTPDGKSQLGDCYATMTGLVWCEGKIARDNGVKLTWNQLREICASPEAVKAALKAVKQVNEAA